MFKFVTCFKMKHSLNFRQMDLKNFSPHIRRAHLGAVINLAKHFRPSPETIASEMVGDCLLYLKNEKGWAPVWFGLKMRLCSAMNTDMLKRLMHTGAGGGLAFLAMGYLGIEAPVMARI